MANAQDDIIVLHDDDDPYSVPLPAPLIGDSIPAPERKAFAVSDGDDRSKKSRESERNSPRDSGRRSQYLAYNDNTSSGQYENRHGQQTILDDSSVAESLRDHALEEELVYDHDHSLVSFHDGRSATDTDSQYATSHDDRSVSFDGRTGIWKAVPSRSWHWGTERGYSRGVDSESSYTGTEMDTYARTRSGYREYSGGSRSAYSGSVYSDANRTMYSDSGYTDESHRQSHSRRSFGDSFVDEAEKYEELRRSRTYGIRRPCWYSSWICLVFGFVLLALAIVWVLFLPNALG